jgi:hypothetical protein
LSGFLLILDLPPTPIPRGKAGEDRRYAGSALRRPVVRRVLGGMKRPLIFEFPDQRLRVQSHVVGVGPQGSLRVHGRQHPEIPSLQLLKVPGADLGRLLDLFEGEPPPVAGLLQDPAYLRFRAKHCILLPARLR